MNEAAVTFETYKSRNPAVNRQQCFRTARGMNWTANRGSQRESWEGESPGGSAVSEWAETHRKVTSLRAAVSSGGPSARGLLMWRVNHPESADSFLPQNREAFGFCQTEEKRYWGLAGRALFWPPVCVCPRERAPIWRRNGANTRSLYSWWIWQPLEWLGSCRKPTSAVNESRCCSVFTC